MFPDLLTGTVRSAAEFHYHPCAMWHSEDVCHLRMLRQHAVTETHYTAAMSYCLVAVTHPDALYMMTKIPLHTSQFFHGRRHPQHLRTSRRAGIEP